MSKISDDEEELEDGHRQRDSNEVCVSVTIRYDLEWDGSENCVETEKGWIRFSGFERQM